MEADLGAGAGQGQQRPIEIGHHNFVRVSNVFSVDVNPHATVVPKGWAAFRPEA